MEELQLHTLDQLSPTRQTSPWKNVQCGYHGQHLFDNRQHFLLTFTTIWLLDNSPIRYQFNAHLTNDQVVNNILVKALTTLPEPDFNLCLYLLNEQMVTEEPVVRLIALQDLIEQARFADFWKLYEGDDIYKELTAEVLGFEDSIRASTFMFG